MYVRGEIDRLDVAYTQFISSARQVAIVQTLLPMTTTSVGEAGPSVRQAKPQAGSGEPASAKGERVPYEFLPDAKSILEEIVPVSFKVRLFKCFLDAAVSEQIARMVAMRGATENADDMVKSLTRCSTTAPDSRRSPASWPRSSAVPRLWSKDLHHRAPSAEDGAKTSTRRGRERI